MTFDCAALFGPLQGKVASVIFKNLNESSN